MRRELHECRLCGIDCLDELCAVCREQHEAAERAAREARIIAHMHRVAREDPEVRRLERLRASKRMMTCPLEFAVEVQRLVCEACAAETEEARMERLREAAMMVRRAKEKMTCHH